MKYAAFDIETTGLNPQNDRVIELALTLPHGVTLSWLIQPGVPITPEITRITGITQKMLDGDGIPFATAWQEFSKAASGYECFIGHNAIRFDWPFIQVECGRAGWPKPEAEIRDTAAIYKGLKLGMRPQLPHKEWAERVLNIRQYGLKFNLAHAANEMGLTIPEGTHRAGVDALLTFDLYETLVKRYPEMEM